MLPYLTKEEKEELDLLLTNGLPRWMPLPGPQSEAYHSEADIIGYGGAAGGGKTDLACGLACAFHKKSIIYRREGTQLLGILERMTEIVGDRSGYNGQDRIWRFKSEDRTIEFGGVPFAGDEKKFQGRPHDLKVFDEATEFLEIQVRFLMGWLRSDDPKIKQRILMTFNPPTTAEGRWVVDFFAPWLDHMHPNPAKYGELRYFTTDPVTGKDIEVENGDPIEIDGDMVTPMSRTFIPAKVEDNPYYMDTGYKKVLQALPEPLRSQMLKGDFMAGTEDDEWQVIPTAWVDAAMSRWEPKDKKGPMDSMGVDVARGGRDKTIIARRHGNWYDELIVKPGELTPDGPIVAAHVIAARRDQAPVHIDIVAWGSSPYDFLVANNIQAIGVNGANASGNRDESGKFRFINMRAEIYWRFRESLDPASDNAIALPPDKELRADLCAPTWKVTPRGIQIESKEELIKRIGRSPDKGDAVVMAGIETVKDIAGAGGMESEFNPYE